MVEAWLLFTPIEKVAEEILCLRKRVMVYNQSGKGTGEALKCPKDDRRNAQVPEQRCGSHSRENEERKL